MTTRRYAIVAAIAAMIAAAMTLLPWVSLEGRNLPMKWAGLGIYYGEDVGVVPSIQPLGWAVVLVAAEALFLVGFELFASGQILAARRWLYVGLAGLAAAVAVLIAVAIAVPSLLYGSALDRLAEFAGAETVEGGRDLLVVPALLGVVLWLVVTAVAGMLGWRATVRSGDEWQAA